MGKKTAKSKSDELTVEQMYTKKTHHEHILTLPDTYIGSIETNKQNMWIYNEETDKMTNKEIDYIPGLYKIYDEILVNARDHSIKDRSCKTLKVTIDQKSGKISVYNDGAGIKVAIHKEHKVYAPELIFGHLLTSGHYKEKGKIVGGKNGYGAKCCNIFSTDFWVETLDATTHQLYKQHFSNNMFKIHKPKVVKVDKKEKPYTKITFIPDFEKFGVEGLSDDMVALFKKRVYDIAACTKKSFKVELNGKPIKISKFEDYIEMYYTRTEDSAFSEPYYEIVNDRWKVGVIYDKDAGYTNISFVNGICTYLGGTHVEHVTKQILDSIIKQIQKKEKNIKVKQSHIKDNLTIFIDCVIEDPAFSSQTKETLTSKLSTFGSRCDVSDDLIKRICNSGIVDEVLQFTKLTQQAAMKKSDGKKKVHIRGIAKLDDADLAGSRNSKHCRLILTEGDSAKSFAVSGLSIIGREKYGVFPLKGKLLNVREANIEQLKKNEEIMNIKQIMGLKQLKKYNTDSEYSKLRYGGIIILTDQDVDGFHIKGLLINFIHYFWPSLLKRNGFIQTLSTPIIKTYKKSDTKKQNPKIFYSLSKYDTWVKDEMKGDLSNWTKPKYYKGLGTSTEKEAKECFIDLDKKIVNYNYNKDDVDNKIINEEPEKEEDDNDNDNETDEDIEKSEISLESIDKSEGNDAILLAFAKNNADKRKTWLKKYNKDEIIDNENKNVTIHDFVHKELKHFSNYDNIRSIPGPDGLKPSQRKIMYSCFKKDLFGKEIKVSQLGGYISEVSEYHHGEMSLYGAIINMAQNYIGSNNINLLVPSGNYGYRKDGGKAASPRYIFTKLNNLVKYIFRKEDNVILKYIIEEGMQIEPNYYCPIIPLSLVNGCIGIGTGYSTDIPSFNPKDLISNLKNLLTGKEVKKLRPWYYGFTNNSETKRIDKYTFKTYGKYSIVNPYTIHITEIPVGISTDNYKLFLDSLISEDSKKATGKKILEKVIDHSGNTKVDIKVSFVGTELKKLIKKDSIMEKLKLTRKVKISNMHLYDHTDTIVKYDTPEDLLQYFYESRIKQYKERKKQHILDLQNKLNIAKYKVKFIEYVHKKKIIMNNKTTRDDVLSKVESYKFPKLHSNFNAFDNMKSYDYLVKMGIFSLTIDRLNELKKEMEERLVELNTYQKKDIKDIWFNELDELDKQYDKWVIEREKKEKEIDETGAKIKKSKKKKNKVKVSVSR